MNHKIITIFLRLALAAGLLSAVADRFGIWNKEVAVWGNWNAFLEYTQTLNPWLPVAVIPAVGIIATAAEIVFGLGLLIGIKTEIFAKLTGFLLLLFALSMSFSTGIKAPLDFSVFAASGAAFALALLTAKRKEA
ncbi:DoxX family protein [Pseudobacter ginsenosidimutans]|uniref:DoxX-like protein n=1 Tax=Pseudobacter ginsenosidimutans TaxID=661488 RepID=A0A4Q7N474_9BACT|nr:DoxX family protein [Pseudobacter ginsenosidimutans]QEC44338.1 DoxX family protein [Pseudobacter ginsenosidimutans]RZS75802.1 hypothetical protein EV199_1677 [Pseudobacter ginsenosidimutans]